MQPPYDPRQGQPYQPPYQPFNPGPPLPAPPPQKGWFGRNTGLALGLGCLVLFMVVCLFIAGIFGIVVSAMRSSDVYQLAFATASSHPAVVTELGSPIEAGWFTSGQINVSGSGGRADLSIPISGPRHSGSIIVLADKAAGKWTFKTLSVVVEGRPVAIDLLPALPAAPAP